jgi:hypothetical protein
MHWIASSGKDALTGTLEIRPGASADQFRANSGLAAAQYSGAILGFGLLFPFYHRAQEEPSDDCYSAASIRLTQQMASAV